MPLPDGVARHGPRLALEYAHGAGHGPFGLGWRLPLRSITRRLDFGPPGAGLVERFLDNGEELVPAADSTFRAARETGFQRYTRIGDGWKVEERDGHVHELGVSAAARIADPAHTDRVIEWLVERSTDACGNVVTYGYLLKDGFSYPESIRYASYEVRFRYEDRPDARRDSRAGFPRRRTQRCTRADLVLNPGPGERVIRTWSFGYALAPGSGVSLLTEIRLIARGAAVDGSQDVRRPPVTFRYTGFDPARFRVRWMSSEEAPPPPLSDLEVALVTLDDAPLPGVLINRDGREYYWANRGEGAWARPRPLARTPLAASFERAGLAFVDMDGSGSADLLVADPEGVPGYYENGGAVGWGSFVAFPRDRRSFPAWADPALRFTDGDSDGLVDALSGGRRAFVWWHNGGSQGWDAPVLAPKPSPDLLDVDLADPDVFLADMTGDGLDDLVRVRSGRVEYWPSLGRGRFGDRVVMLGSPRIRRQSSDDAVVLADVDGDGCADLVYIAGGVLTVYPNQNGQGFAGPITVEGVPAPVPGTVRAARLSGRAGAGLVWNSRARREIGYVQFDFDTGEPPYLLTAIDNGAGLFSEIHYRSAIEDYLRDRTLGATWTTHFPIPYLVVARTVETDRVSGRVCTVEFLYHEAHFERRSRQFQGYRTTERVEKGDASRPDTRQIHHFLMAQERVPGNGPEHAALNGLLARVETLGLDGSPSEGLPYRVETSEHGLVVLDRTSDGRTRSFVFVTRHRQEHRERGGDVRVEETEYTYDATGNVTLEVLRGSGTSAGTAVPVITRTTQVEYATPGAHYILGRPARVTLRSSHGALLAEKRLYYDGADFTGLPLGKIDRGLTSREEEWVMSQADFDAHYAGMDAAALGYTRAPNADAVASLFALTQARAFDARGLVTATRDALSRETRQGFDPFGLFRVSLVDALGESRFDYDPATGQITRTTHPDGSQAMFAYDAQGRVLATALPGQMLAGAPTSYAYDETQIPNRRIARFRQPDGTISLGVTYFDGYGKEFQQRVESEPGVFVVSGHQVLNPWGDVREEFEPTFAATADFGLPATQGRPSRKFFFDALGRVVETVNFNGGVSTAEFQPFRVITRDANDNDATPANKSRGQFDTPHVEEFDALRQLTRVIERRGALGDAVTIFETGPAGELLSISDGRGVKSRFRYDRKRRRLHIDSREAGARTIWYDARGKVVRTLDGAANDLRAEWDTAGRLLRLTQAGAVVEEYRYDTPAQNAFGRLAEASYGGGKQTFTYDKAGRLTERAYQFDGDSKTQTLRFEYDTLGRESAVVHTDGTRFERQLTLNGWLKAVPNVLKSVTYDPRGLPAEFLYQNGVRTACKYTPGPGRLRFQTTTAPDGSVLGRLEFTLDLMEVVIARNDAAPGGVGAEAFTYDPLYQLTGVSSTEKGQPVKRSYTYAADANLLRFDEAKGTLLYNDSARPDRLTGLLPDGGVQFDAHYDGSGNLLNLPGRSFTYNAKHELVHIAAGGGKTADYHYDHEGARVSKRVDDGHGHSQTTYYLGDHAEVRDGVPAYFVRAGRTRVAVRFKGVTRFVHGDGLGGTAFFTDVGGHKTGNVAYHPFGNIADVHGDVDFRTFSLHPVDPESGLVYMRRRYYAPEIGRFLTPDLVALFQPEEGLHAPARLHLYAFVANDPLNKTDPTGLSFWSFLGSVAGVIVGVIAAVAIVAAVVATGGVLGVVLGIGLALGASLVATGVSYLIASNVDPNSAGGEFLRGFMIGFNAGMNAVLASAIFGPVVGVALGVINFLATFDGVARNSFYQGVLAWSSWLMPMSWGVTALGLVFYVLNLIIAGVTFQQWSAAKIDKLGVDWKTGSLYMSGGLIRNPTAFNMGNFVFLNPNYADNSTPDRNFDAVLRHETGHTLNTAAFGSEFGLDDLFGENVFGGGANDYGERLAESHADRAGRPTIPMWG
jgi:RHS repeat-associated protein